MGGWKLTEYNRTSKTLDAAGVKLAVLKVSFGICALPEAELFRKLEEFYLEAYARGVADRPSDETSELSRALHVIDEAGKLSDWINRARPVITELMEAYARLVRSHSGMGAMELAEVQPWRCMEYIGAEELLRAQPVAIVEITTEKATAPPSSTLADFGYAPGVYAFHCLDCDQEDLGDKRSIRCKPCAEKALAAQNGNGEHG